MSTPTSDEPASLNPPTPPAPPTRDELVTLVARSLAGSSTSESRLAGQALAAQSQLPKLVAENLGAGFGQWDFFPEPADIVDFARGYTRPASEEEVWTLARSWASDDAAARQTVLALIGRDILQQELRRIEVPKLRELIDEARPTRARELRVSLGLEVAATKEAASAPAKARKPAAPKPVAAPAPVSASSSSPAPSAEAAPRPMRMPKPEFKAPAKAAPAPPAQQFAHPKFGTGSLVARDGVGPEAKLTIKFESGPKTLLAKYVTEV